MTHLEAEDLLTCSGCGAKVPDLQHYGEDCDFCDKCAADWQDAFASCVHRWEDHTDEYGDSGRYCSRCGGFVADEIGDLMFPLICDGWVSL